MGKSVSRAGKKGRESRLDVLTKFESMSLLDHLGSWNAFTLINVDSYITNNKKIKKKSTTFVFICYLVFLCQPKLRSKSIYHFPAMDSNKFSDDHPFQYSKRGKVDNSAAESNSTQSNFSSTCKFPPKKSDPFSFSLPGETK